MARITGSVLVLLFVTGISSAYPSYDAAKAEEKAQVCVACHGPDGNSSVTVWPKIAGQNEKYVLRQLQAFKKGEQGPRSDPSMLGMVAGLNENDMALLAQYYARQTMSPGKAQDKDIAVGQQLYRGGDLKTGVVACGACHGPRGLGNAEAGMPRVGGQYQAYTLAQLQAYRDGKRSTDANGIMRDIAKRMTPKQMAAVANYIEGLH